MSRKTNFHDFYARRSPTRLMKNDAATILGRASADQLYAFRGDAITQGIVVRVDINGYSAWSRDKKIAQRVSLMDQFFTHLVIGLDRFRGVYFRDEGDCMVALFSDYFRSGFTVHDVIGFCMHAVSTRFGYGSELSAKCSLSVGQLAFFQKSHETGTDDWSCEGQPFVRAARLEAAIDSRPHICFFKDEYDQYFSSGITMAKPGASAAWEISNEALIVPGLGFSGGWADLTFIESKQA